MCLPYHVSYSSLLKAHYFTAGCVRGGPSLWTLCRRCINQTSHSGEGSTHWHSTAHSTLEDKRENTPPELLAWKSCTFWRWSPTIPTDLYPKCLQHFSTTSWHCPTLPCLHSGQQDVCMGKWHQWTVSESLKNNVTVCEVILYGITLGVAIF